MADRRIYELTTKSAALGANDYFAVDNGTEAESKKLPTSYFTDQLADINNILGAKNLIPDDYLTESSAEGGITVTPLGDGTYRLNGTATATVDIRLTPWGTSNYSKMIDLPLGSYKLTGCGTGGTGAYILGIVYCDGTNRDNLGYDNGSGYTFDHESESMRYEIKITAWSGASFNNVIFKPMLRPTSIVDETFVPYAKTNSQLTEDVADLNSALNNLVIVQSLNVTTDANGVCYIGGREGYRLVAAYPTWGTQHARISAVYTTGSQRFNYNLTITNTAGSPSANISSMPTDLIWLKV